jgi:hypothetical protein
VLSNISNLQSIKIQKTVFRNHRQMNDILIEGATCWNVWDTRIDGIIINVDIKLEFWWKFLLTDVVKDIFIMRFGAFINSKFNQG